MPAKIMVMLECDACHNKVGTLGEFNRFKDLVPDLPSEWEEYGYSDSPTKSYFCPKDGCHKAGGMKYEGLIIPRTGGSVRETLGT